MHTSPQERAACDAQAHDAAALFKMSQVGFAGPRKVPRTHSPARRTKRGRLELFVFSEEEILPWSLEPTLQEP